MPRADRRPLPFRERDISRMVRAIRSSGEQVDQVIVDPKSGTITVNVKRAADDGDQAA
jgi:hypothetical protein